MEVEDEEQEKVEVKLAGNGRALFSDSCGGSYNPLSVFGFVLSGFVGKEERVRIGVEVG